VDFDFKTEPERFSPEFTRCRDLLSAARAFVCVES
jgi:hypothetical protein